VALDNDFATWTAYSNEYWPADYLVDRSGQIRAIHFGEGDYAGTEADIRALLGVSNRAASVADSTPTGAITPETYLGADRLDPERYAGSHIVTGRRAIFELAASVPPSSISYSGWWTLTGQYALAGSGARLELHFIARDVFIVLGGTGKVTTMLDGKPLGSIDVRSDRLYTVLRSNAMRNGLLDLRFSPGVQAYSFTFG
jgi:hypothetical protein